MKFTLNVRNSKIDVRATRNLSSPAPVFMGNAETMRWIAFLLLLISTRAFSQSIVDRGKELYEGKRPDEAAKLFTGVNEDHPDYATARYYLGRIAFDRKAFDDAVDFFEEATEAKGGNQSTFFTWLGDTYATIASDANVIRQGMLAPKMKAAWEKAIALDDGNLNARLSLIQFYTQAPSFMGGSMDKAKETARQIVAIAPAQGHRSLGNLYLKEKNLVAAEKEYLEMAKIDPSFLPVLGNFYVNEKMHEKAFALFEEQLKKDPNNMLAVYQLGKVSAVSGQRLDQGEQHLLKYLAYTPQKNEPSHAGANMRLAQIYEKKGRPAEAKLKYETALKLDNNLQEAKEGLSRVSKL
jgi:tetratricopeptide (TPR) repeat protein